MWFGELQVKILFFAKCQVFVISVGLIEVQQISIKEQSFTQQWKRVKRRLIGMNWQATKWASVYNDLI